MDSINKEGLKSFIEPHFYQDLTKEEYKVESIKSSDLLTYTRFDLAFKLLYLEMKDKDVKFSTEIYREHIRAFSLETFSEPGSEDKNSIERFIEAFHQTFEDIKKNGFDSSKTLIPLSLNGSIANGAHRVASAIYLEKEVECIEIETDNHLYDYQFFYSRNVASDILDTVATKFVEYSHNIYIAMIWPTGQGNDKALAEIIPNVVYKKEMRLNPNGAHNLLSQIYYGEEWLGNVEDNFRGAKSKLTECFKTFDPVRVIAFQADSLEEVLKIKEKVREVFNIGKHSIHITDTKEEAMRTAKIVFNENSIHFLNYAKPNKFIDTHHKIDIFKDFLKVNDFSSDDVLLESSIVLSAYGLREAKDTDFFHCADCKIKIEFKDINIHDSELKYYNKNKNKNELIYNPKFYFHFNDLKFISFTQLYKMKTNRAEEKDKNDSKMMEALIEHNRVKEYVNKIKQRIYYEKIKLRKKIISILQEIGVYNISRNIYRMLKDKK